MEKYLQYICCGVVAEFELRKIMQQNSKRYIKALSTFIRNILLIFTETGFLEKKPRQGQQIRSLE